MKLKSFKHEQDYRFLLTFENGETRDSDLRGLLERYVDFEGVRPPGLILIGVVWNLIMV